MRITLVVLAAGMSSRYGRLKQLEPVGPDGEALMDYAVFDAVRAGFSNVVFVVRDEIAGEIRAHVASRFAGTAPIAFAYQSLDDVPAGFTIPADRQKPWGTAHAVLAAEQAIDGPFAVCNADDYYGASAYRTLVDHFEGLEPREHGIARVADRRGAGLSHDARGETGTLKTNGIVHPVASSAVPHALVGYKLRETLSEFGGVSRAICKCDPTGHLEQMEEVKQIEEHQGRLAGTTESGEHIPLSGDEVVSMNLWGFTAALFPVLRAQFADFLQAHGSSTQSEFLIPTALNQQVAQNRARLRVLQAREQWIGMTFTQDRARVVQRIGELVRQGRYPRSIASALHDSQRP